MMTDAIDRSLGVVWAVLGAGVVLKPSGYVGWTDLALWTSAAWLVVIVGMCYMRMAPNRS